MSEPQSADLRISDAERESAMTALGEHMSTGRLNIDEYGDRSAQVSAAKTRGELMQLFSDLPAPHPVLGGRPQPAPAPMPAPAAPAPPAPVRYGPSPVKQRVMAAAVPLAVIISCVLVFGFGVGWIAWLLIPAVTVFGGAIFGNDWHDHRAREKQHELQRKQWDERRELQKEQWEEQREWQREQRDEWRERQRDRRRGRRY